MNALQQVSGETVLVPAYGKTYKTDEQLIGAWNAGKDFQLSNGQYCSIRDSKYLKDTSSRVLITKDYFSYIRV